MQAMITAALPHILEALAVLLMAVLTWAAAWAKRKLGIQIADSHIQKAHQALLTATLAGIGRGFKGNVLEAFIVDAARESSPTAMKKLEAAASPEVLRNIVLSKVQIAAQDKLSDTLAKTIPTGR